MKISMTKFAENRHFNPDFTGTKITSHTPEDFVAKVGERSFSPLRVEEGDFDDYINTYISEMNWDVFTACEMLEVDEETFADWCNGVSPSPDVEQAVRETLIECWGAIYGCVVKSGYAPFCRHIFVSNFTDAISAVEQITDSNRHLLQSGYSARREGELPVLSRWFNREDIEEKESYWLDIIVYSKEQLENEGESIDGDWGIVAILSAEEPNESPMNPITMMRNALGVSEGGSGVAIDRDAYMKSVEYWSKNALIK